MSIHKIVSGDSEVEIDTLGAYVRSLRLRGREIFMPPQDDKQTHGGCAMLIPYANRVRNATYTWEGRVYTLPKNSGQHSIHGLTMNKEWYITKTHGEATLTLSLEDKGYPSEIRCALKMRVDGPSFSVEMNFKNMGGLSAPIAPGMHPYFLFKDKWRILPQEGVKMLEYTDGYFPTGRLIELDEKALSSYSNTFDNCFLLGEKITLDLGDHKILVETVNMPYYVVYNGRYSRGISVAVEPMTAAPDAFNNHIGLATINPGESFSCKATFTLTQ